MRNILLISGLLFLLLLTSCSTENTDMTKVLFIHHSTGNNVWRGKTNKYIVKLTNRGDVSKYFARYNRENKTDYIIKDLFFPNEKPYGWKNYPYDYYNIWVKNAGEKPYMEEPTLEILTKQYDVIIFKHCYPVSRLVADTGNPDIDSEEKRVENYKLQYEALKKKMHEFPGTKFIVWTPAVCTQNTITEEQARGTNDFYHWIMDEWDEKGDNIYIWDFYSYETEGGLYLAEKNASSPDNCHPGDEFSARMAPLFASFIINVIETERGQEPR